MRRRVSGRITALTDERKLLERVVWPTLQRWILVALPLDRDRSFIQCAPTEQGAIPMDRLDPG